MPDHLTTNAVSGTIWSGRAATIRSPHITLTDVRWRARPLALLTARLSYLLNIKIGDGAIQTVASVSIDQKTRLKELSGVVPLSALRGIAQLSTFDGRIGLDLDDLLVVDQWITDAHGSVDLVSLSLTVPITEALGNYELIFDGASDAVLEGRFREVDAPLAASGTLALHADRNWELSGTVKPTAATSRQLSQALTFLGSRQADGSYPISAQGRN